MSNKTFKCRASSLGAVFTSPRNKSEVISETTKTMLEDWIVEDRFGIRKEFNSKYTDKGLAMEDQAIQEYNSLFGVIGVKNDVWYENEYITGTPDLIFEDKVVDIKCSYSPFTFPMFDKTIPTKAYFYQLQAYMYLTGLNKAELAYVLLSSPEEIIEREAKKIMWNEQLPQEFYDVVLEEVREAHTYDHITIKDRIKIFSIDRDDDVIGLIPNKIKECREYIELITN